MFTFARLLTGAAVLCGIFVALSTNSSGQAPPPTADNGQGAVVGTGTFTAFVENMDRSLAFFHDVFGMDVPALPESKQRPYNRSNPQLFAMFDIPGARERHQSARVPGTRVTVELMEIQDVDHRTVPLRIQDPGTATLVLIVRDLDATLTRVLQAGAPIVTAGAKPVTLADGTRAILIRDLDNRFIELRQPATVADTTAAGNIVDLRLSIAVNDLERTSRLYSEVMGFTLDGQTAWSADQATRSLTGLAKAEVRRSRVRAPGSPLWIEFVEFKGVDRAPLRMRIQDRGAARLQLRAQNIDALVSRMKAAGMKVVSQGEHAVPIPPNFKGALVADLDNFFVTPFEPVAAPAK
jgi:catechol 2,3-dioxygenase-like lactoylglutathione lyase family enzyme